MSLDITTMDVGPWGGPGGDKWRFERNIRKIVVAVGDNVICSLSLTSNDGDGNEEEIQFGRAPAYHKEIVTLKDDEYLTNIEGHSSTSPHGLAVGSLTFITNLGSHGPFGSSMNGSRFYAPVTTGKLVGLVGRAGEYLDAIGVILHMVDHEVVLGPWGGSGGKPWTFRRSFKNFQVSHKNGVLLSITFDNSTTFGGDDDEKVLYPEVDLEDDERILYIKGVTGKLEEDGIIVKGISFVTNKRTYGPYGDEGSVGDDLFEAPVTHETGIYIFSGRAGNWINAISCHYFFPYLP